MHFSAHRRRSKHQLSGTHTHAQKELDHLKDAISDGLLSLEEAKSKRSLTPEERHLLSRFRGLLH